MASQQRRNFKLIIKNKKFLNGSYNISARKFSRHSRKVKKYLIKLNLTF